MVRAKFQPDVGLGELAMLSKLATLAYDDEIASPLNIAMSELKGTKHRARYARARLESAFGPLFEITENGRSMVPNAAGRSLGAAYDLFDVIAAAAIDENVNHDELLKMIKEFHKKVDDESAGGVLARP